MKAVNQTRQLYIVISQTGTLLSRLLKLITGAEYNHASLSVSADLEQMYSFGRLHPYNPFWGGFVMESPHKGTFKRFDNTKVVVIAVEINEERYIEICNYLQWMYLEKEKYHYNYLGLFLAAFHIKYAKSNCYYCSEFVKDILTKGKINGTDCLLAIVQPIHFLQIPHKEIYCGILKEYKVDLDRIL